MKSRAGAGMGFIVLLGGLLYWFLVFPPGQDHGTQIQMAFGNVSGDTVELHAVVNVVMAHKGAGKQVSSKPMSWPEWIESHFVLQDQAGTRRELKRRNNTRLIRQDEIIGTQEFFLVAKLKVGTDYTLEYLPVLGEPARYHYSFTAPAAPQRVRSLIFEPVP